MSEQEKTEAVAESKPKSKKKLFIILGLVLILVGAGVPTALLLMGGEEPPAEEHAEPVEAEPKLTSFELEPIIVNLSESTSFLKVKLVIEFDENIITAAAGGEGEGGGHGIGGGASGGGEAVAGPPAAIKERMHHIKDAVIRILSSKTAADVLSAQGKETIKEELIESINEAIGLDEGPVVAVYFLEFIVQ